MAALVLVWSSLGRGTHLADPTTWRTLCGRNAWAWSADDRPLAVTCRTCRRKGT